MKKILAVLLIMIMAFGLTGCALAELFGDKDDVVDLGDGKRAVKCQQKNKAPANTAREFGWQELLNFLQYDGSGKQPFERRDVNSETENHADAGRAGVRSRRSV